MTLRKVVVNVLIFPLQISIVIKVLKILVIFCLAMMGTQGLAQQNNGSENVDLGSFSGGFQTSANFFMRDSLIGAFNIPQYDYQLFGAQSWLDLGYTRDGFDLGIRFDAFNNSNLLNPNDSYTSQGIGRWHIAKEMDKFDIRVGHIYDQIGSGIIYRAFEERALLIDNALIGARIGYKVNDNWNINVFTGRQRRLFTQYAPNMKGAVVEGYVDFTSKKEGAKLFAIAPGVGFVNRTLDDAALSGVVDVVKTYQDVDRFKPEYNTYAYSLFNTLTYGPINLYVEGAIKSSEAFNDPNSKKTNADGSLTSGKMVKASGSVIYGSISYAGNGLGVTLETKRTENFEFRTDPNLLLINGIINYIPAMNRQNVYRLTARYSPATQLLSEQAYQADVKYRWSKKLTTSANFSYITDLNGDKLFQELYTEVLYKYKRKWQLKGGVQLLQYNQAVYEQKTFAPLVETITPYVDFLYKFTRKKSIRTELQFLSIGDDIKAGKKQDYGDWAFALVEFAIAPHWSFVVSDMYNITPGKNSPVENGEGLDLHYPRFDIYYTYKANRFSLSYIKQVEGVVCNGGICRLEPAFSGFNFSATSSF